MSVLNDIKVMCDGIEYSRNVPEEAKALAIENGIVIIVGGSDDLMYCYGAYSYLTDMQEHSYGWDGDDLLDAEKELKDEATQLGLMIWWCGAIVRSSVWIDDYDTDKSGAFSYTVKEGIEFLNFKVLEDKDGDDVYCTGIIIQLPADFKPSIK